MRVKNAPQKSVKCVVCNVDLGSPTMYKRHITTYAHQAMIREDETLNARLNIYKEQILIIKTNFRLVPSQSQEVDQIPILKSFDFFLKKCNADVDDFIWTAVNSGFFVMVNQQAVNNIVSAYSGVGHWGTRIFVDGKNWMEVKAARSLTEEQWEQMIEELEQQEEDINS